MSFIYSRALVEEFSRANNLDTDASALLNGSPTPHLFLSSDKMMAFCRLSRFGMTCAPLTADCGAELLMWWLAGFRAKTSALQEKEPASLVNAPACGLKWRASLAKFDPVSCSWKTVQLSLLEDSELSSVTWPRSGMTADGQCWELPMSERRTSGIDSGFWPTPVASDTSSRTKPYAQGGTPLSLAVKWPTPTVCGNYNRKGASATSGDGLATAVRMWPTPTAHNAKEGAHKSEYEKNTPTLAAQAGGPLNPTWVEWLMGWPLGWTDLKPSATDKFQPAPQPLGIC